MKLYKLEGFKKSNTKNKMYDAILINRMTNKKRHIPFGDKRYENYSDKTGLNLYPNLIHGDNKRLKAYKSRHQGFIKKGFYSPAYFSMRYLWSR